MIDNIKGALNKAPAELMPQAFQPPVHLSCTRAISTPDRIWEVESSAAGDEQFRDLGKEIWIRIFHGIALTPYMDESDIYTEREDGFKDCGKDIWIRLFQ